MTTHPTSELSPCPFCGGEEVIFNSGGHDLFHQCVECRAKGPSHLGDGVFRSWNTRVASSIAEVDCGNACGYQEPYGFVPEADCPVHDKYSNALVEKLVEAVELALDSDMAMREEDEGNESETLNHLRQALLPFTNRAKQGEVK